MYLAKNLGLEVNIAGDILMHDSKPMNFSDLPLRKSTAAIILNDLGQILLVQKINYADGYWNFPGGGVDGDEQPEQAILRELSEEVGLNEVKISKKSDFQSEYEWPTRVVINTLIKKGILYRGQKVNYFLIRLDFTPQDLNIQKEEIKRFKWVNVSDLSAFLKFPNQLGETLKVLESFGKLTPAK